MAHLPNARYVAVARAKIEYLLDAEHPDNDGKAPFFLALGFRPGSPTVFEEALKQHPVAHEIETAAVTGHGVKYTIICSLVTPNGGNPCIRTVWIIDTGRTLPRLITAYPHAA